MCMNIINWLKRYYRYLYIIQWSVQNIIYDILFSQCSYARLNNNVVILFNGKSISYKTLLNETRNQQLSFVTLL